MLIQPDTYIRLIKNCPLDKTYNNTIYFNNETEQVEYFKNTLQGIPFSKQSYQRHSSGVLHIQEKAENLYNCNYLMFQNSAFGKKYFYAFVTSVEYVNNVSSMVTYEIDVMQTWFFEYRDNLKPCFVEREHSETDNIGDNLVPENLETGDHYLSLLDVEHCPIDAGDYAVIVAHGTNKKQNDDGSYSCVYNNVFSGIDFNIFNEPSHAYDYLKNLNDKGESSSVVSVFTVPKALAVQTARNTFSFVTEMAVISHGLSDPYNDNFENYTPKNNKLFTSPYFGLICTSSSGPSATYSYEYFKDPQNPTFWLHVSIDLVPQMNIAPYEYKGVSGRANYNEELVCKDFPICAYATDASKEYCALNAGKLTSSLISTVLNPFGSGTINSKNVQLNLFSGIINMLGTERDIYAIPPKIQGQGANALNYARNTVGFMFYKYKIRREYAEIIDSYFSMFGYATHRVKVPNIKARPYWNYVKTNGCTVRENIPALDAESISKIFDSGITFWKSGSYVGDYSLDNSPV